MRDCGCGEVHGVKHSCPECDSPGFDLDNQCGDCFGSGVVFDRDCVSCGGSGYVEAENVAAGDSGLLSILDLNYRIVRGGNMAAKVEPIKFGLVCGEALEMMDSGAKLGDVNRYLLDNAGHAFRYRNRDDFRQLLVTYKRAGMECAAKARLAKTNQS